MMALKQMFVAIVLLGSLQVFASTAHERKLLPLSFCGDKPMMLRDLTIRGDRERIDFWTNFWLLHCRDSLKGYLVFPRNAVEGPYLTEYLAGYEPIYEFDWNDSVTQYFNNISSEVATESTGIISEFSYADLFVSEVTDTSDCVDGKNPVSLYRIEQKTTWLSEGSLSYAKIEFEPRSKKTISWCVPEVIDPKTKEKLKEYPTILDEFGSGKKKLAVVYFSGRSWFAPPRNPDTLGVVSVDAKFGSTKLLVDLTTELQKIYPLLQGCHYDRNLVTVKFINSQKIVLRFGGSMYEYSKSTYLYEMDFSDPNNIKTRALLEQHPKPSDMCFTVGIGGPRYKPVSQEKVEIPTGFYQTKDSLVFVLDGKTIDIK